MNPKKHLSILEFSRLTGIGRDTLRFYDRIGLLSPETRGENKYRYYSRRQLENAYLISNLRLLGVGLEDIRQYSANRTPEQMLALFARHEERIQAEIVRMQETSQIMTIYSNMVKEALCHVGDQFLIEERTRERILLCPPIPEDMTEEDGELAAYDFAHSQGYNWGYPFGFLVPRDNLLSDVLSLQYRYYFKTVKRGNVWKPAGTYAVAYGTGDPYHAEDVFQRLLDFIQENGLEIVGDAFGEVLLNELAVPSMEEGCIRIEIPVKKLGESIKVTR